MALRCFRYGGGSNSKGFHTDPRVSAGHFLTRPSVRPLFRVPARALKNPNARMGTRIFWCECSYRTSRKMRLYQRFSVSDIIRFHPHPYWMRLKSEGLSHGLKTCHRQVFYTAFRVPAQALKNPNARKGTRIFWCERWDSNPHGVTTRTSNVLVYHSNTLASAYVL